MNDAPACSTFSSNKTGLTPRHAQTRQRQQAGHRGEEDQDPVKLLVKPCHRNCVVLGWAGLGWAVCRDPRQFLIFPCTAR